MKHNKAIRLLHKYLFGKPSFEEKARVEKWYEEIDESSAVADATELARIKEELYQRTWAELGSGAGAKLVPFYKKPRFRMAAAVIAAVCITSACFLIFSKPKAVYVVATTVPEHAKNDVAAPTSRKAVLTLADGSTILLDSAGSGSLATQGNSTILKLNNGRIAYNAPGTAGENVQYNTLTIPRGSRPMQLRLADGTEVWLNVASSITYPVAFAGSERKVEITGEVYFEVSGKFRTAMPFVVKKGDMEVVVLGTHFNVNAYDDESAMRVTLLEGAVRVSRTAANESLEIKPGEQAELRPHGKIGVKKDVDVDEVMAWRKNWFDFNSLTVPEIMRQIEKWYDVTVAYEANPGDKHFSGIVSRNNNVSDVLSIMEKAGIKFKIEGKKITVM